MAEITKAAVASWNSAQTRAQFGTITWLRWRIFRNGLQKKGKFGDLLAVVIMVPIFLGVIVFPSIAAGFGAWYFVSHGKLDRLALIFWGIFAFCQFTSIQLGQPGTTFDPTELIRFPLSFPRYAAVRTFFGLLSPSNIVSTLMSLAVAVGITVADPSLMPYALVALAAFALVNIFFTRMLFAWVDRWLSTRRAREIFTGLIVIGSLGFQYVNFTLNPAFQNGRHANAANAARMASALRYYHRAEPVLSVLPPGLTTSAIKAAHLGQQGMFSAEVLGILAFASLFFAIFATRLHKEFHGENLSDVANAVSETSVKKPAVAVPASVVSTHSMRFGAPQTIAAVLKKEFISLRRNTGIFYSLVAPLVMVVLFANMRAGRTPSFILFPAAVAYTLLGIAPLCFNSLGAEAAGIQFYFLAPVKMRDVFLAKNLMSVALALIEFIAVFAAITYISHAPSAAMTLAVLLWAAFTMFVTLAVGNRRSVTAPKKIDMTKVANKQASPLSAFMGIGLLLLCAALGAGVVLAAMYFDQPWIMPPAMLVLAVAGSFIYVHSLGTMDRLLADHRDTLSETLCKS